MKTLGSELINLQNNNRNRWRTMAKTIKNLPSGQWEVYVIETKSGKLYTGITNNFDRRLMQHEKRQKGARFFNFSSPERVVFRKPYPNRSEASKQEIAIKKMSRKEKQALIDSANSNEDQVDHG